MFLSATSTELALIFLGMFLGGITKGIIGLALPVIAIAIMVLVLPPLEAIAIMAFPLLLTNLWQGMRGGVTGWNELAKRYWLLVTACFLTMFFTSLNATKFSPAVLFLMMGCVLIFFVGANYAAPTLRLSERYERPAAIVAGLSAGLLGGATSVYGPPLNMYLASLRLEKTYWIRSIGFIYGICGFPLIIGFSLNGMLNQQTAPLSLLACIPAMAGIFLGQKVQDLIPQNAFRHTMFAVLVLFGLNYIRRGLIGA